MIRRSASIKSEKASRYLQQLCKHFAHKAPVEFDTHNGRVEFPFGLCLMQVDGERLSIQCESQSDEAFARMRFVLDDHVKRFAWKEELELQWDDGGRQPD